MQDVMGQSGQPSQGGRPVQISGQGHGASLPPALVLGRVPQQDEYTVAPE